MTTKPSFVQLGWLLGLMALASLVAWSWFRDSRPNNEPANRAIRELSISGVVIGMRRQDVNQRLNIADDSAQGKADDMYSDKACVTYVDGRAASIVGWSLDVDGKTVLDSQSQERQVIQTLGNPDLVGTAGVDSAPERALRYARWNLTVQFKGGPAGYTTYTLSKRNETR